MVKKFCFKHQGIQLNFLNLILAMTLIPESDFRLGMNYLAVKRQMAASPGTPFSGAAIQTKGMGIMTVSD